MILPITPGDQRASGPHVRDTFYLYCSRRIFRRWWVATLGIHALCVVVYVAWADAYVGVFSRGLGVPLSSFGFRVHEDAFPSISKMYLAFAFPHAFCGMWMIGWSLYSRSLEFGRPKGPHKPKQVQHDSTESPTRHHLLGHNRLRCVVQYVWSRTFGPDGLFSLTGKYFLWVFLAQEMFEILLQTLQAYRMSRWVSRPWLNRTYIALTVVNCWSTSIISHIYRSDPASERLLCRVWDMFMDIVSSIAVPTFMMIPYSQLAEDGNRNFPYEYLYNNGWLINTLNEYRIMVLASWWEVASTILFAVLILLCLETIKESVNRFPDENRVATAHELREAIHASRLTFASVIKPKRVVKWAHAVFILWGVAIVALHAHSESRKLAPHCQLQLYPWFQNTPACSFVKMNCEKNGQAGTKTEVRSVLTAVAAEMVMVIEFRHCSALSIPEEIQSFRNVFGIRIYDATLVEWSEEAAVTEETFPSLTFVHYVNVNMTEFPRGLRAGTLPAALGDLEFARTNLSWIPENLDDYWPVPYMLILDDNFFGEIPPVTVRLNLPVLSLVNNNISVLPTDIFTASNAASMWLNGNPISELPTGFVASASLYSLHLEKTHISWLPPWVDEFLTQEDPILKLGNTPFCDIITADRSRYPQYDLVKCRPTTGDLFTYYPYELEATFDEEVHP